MYLGCPGEYFGRILRATVALLVTLESFSGLDMVGIVENGGSDRSRGGAREAQSSPYLG